MGLESIVFLYAETPSMSCEAEESISLSRCSNSWPVCRGEVVCNGSSWERLGFGALQGYARLAAVLTGAESFSF